MKNIFLVVILFALLTGCSEDKTSDNNNNVLFSADIDSEYLRDGQEGYLLISNSEGESLEWIQYFNDSQIELEGDESNDKIQITNIKYVPIQSAIYLYTRSEILPGRNWTFRRSPDYPGGQQISLNYVEAPQHDGYIFSTTGYCNYEAMGDIQEEQPYEIQLEKPEDNLFVLLKNIRSNSYKWVSGLQSGSYDINLNDMVISPTMYSTVPSVGNDVSTYLKGYINANQHNNGYYYIGKTDNYDAINRTIEVNTPEVFADYNFSVTISEVTGNLMDLYYYSYYGTDIPSQVPTLEAVVDLNSTENQNLWFSATGEYDISYSYWQESDSSAFDIAWYFYGPPTQDHHTLTNLPAELARKMQNFSKEEVDFHFISLCTYDNIKNYASICDAVHSSDSYFNEDVHLFLVRSIFPDISKTKERINPSLLSPDEF